MRDMIPADEVDSLAHTLFVEMRAALHRGQPGASAYADGVAFALDAVERLKEAGTNEPNE